jgi:predicted ArsR family transcriptional regulator
MSKPSATNRDVTAVAMLAEPARRAVYEWVVAQHRPVGRVETATALDMKPSLAAFHLDRLAEGGLLDATYRRINERRGPGAGRPARVYWRGDREVTVSLPERRYELAARTLAEALERDPNAAAVAARDAGRAMGLRLGAAARRDTARRTPLAALQRGLRDLGYEPIEDRDEGAIRLRNCPFDALVDEHRSLVCGMNLGIAEGIAEAIGSGLPVRPVVDPEPGFCCVAFRASG